MKNLVLGPSPIDHTAAEAAFSEVTQPTPPRASSTRCAPLNTALRRPGQSYLDYTGAGVYAVSQVNAHTDLLSRSIAGNPHSGNLASRAMTAWIRRSRRPVLDYFRAFPNEYESF